MRPAISCASDRLPEMCAWAKMTGAVVRVRTDAAYICRGACPVLRLATFDTFKNEGSEFKFVSFFKFKC